MVGIRDFICSFIFLLVPHVLTMSNKAIENL